MNNKNSKYEIVFVTNLPAFYKINLYNEISKRCKIFVIFLDRENNQRNLDFYSGEKKFEYYFLEKNNIFKMLFCYFKLLNSIRFNRIVLGGWERIIYWFTAFLSPTFKNGLTIESSYLESTVNGYKGFLKKIFISRINYVYASGLSQKKLALDLGFKRDVIITHGVGLFNIISQPLLRRKYEVRNFLYVGRLSPEKNLEFLISIFNDLPNLSLTIVGFGPLDLKLKSIANKNVFFMGGIDNCRLNEVYQSHDVFILPSISEPWGLVVEEAFNNGLPVIVSDNVGCCDSIVENNINGLIFSLNKRDSLKDAIIKMTDIEYYNSLIEHISYMNFEEIATKQINCYI